MSIEKSREAIKIKRSLFISTADYVKGQEEAELFISKISKEFKDATHNCWAYKIGQIEMSSDNGEPSGTAGLPILNAIKSSGLDRIAVIVTRYFGGIKLGIRGLIDVYESAAKRALENATKKVFFKGRIVKIRCNYDEFDRIRYNLRKSGYFYVSPPVFTESIELNLFVPVNESINLKYVEIGKMEIEKENLISIGR